jgi:Putative auto-transporter adhesin, head GIN domain
MRISSRLLVTTIVLFAVSEAAPAQTSVQVPAFSAIEISNGGHAVLRSAPAPRVTILTGSLDYTRIAVTNAGVLVIDKCRVKCPRGYVLDVEILAPGVSSISFANGGWIRTVGTFAPQPDLSVDISHGGTIDVRSLAAERVTASVQHGGRILTVPRESLSATVTQGGAITYWGNGRVRQSVQHGGVVQKGSPDEIDLPLAEPGPALISPPVPPHQLRRRH